MEELATWEQRKLPGKQASQALGLRNGATQFLEGIQKQEVYKVWTKVPKLSAFNLKLQIDIWNSFEKGVRVNSFLRGVGRYVGGSFQHQ